MRQTNFLLPMSFKSMLCKVVSILTFYQGRVLGSLEAIHKNLVKCDAPGLHCVEARL
jgi:hypothetical protein